MDDQHCAPDVTDLLSCPVSGAKGKAVKIVSLKALLRPHALADLEPKGAFRFCPDATCDVVYFSGTQTYNTDDVKVPVFQKDQGSAVPVCYCFGHSRLDVIQALQEDAGESLESSIRAHIKAGRCGCEVTNPQGSCCLGNVKNLLTDSQLHQAHS